MHHLVFLSLFAACVASIASAAAPCSTSETAQLDALASSFGGLLHVCKTDSGFDLYPFSGFPPSDKTSIVCNGRACPSVIYNLLQSSLPDCTVNVQGTPMTPIAYLKKLCPTDTATVTTAPPSSNTTTNPPSPTTTTNTPATTTTTNAPTTNTSTTTTPATTTARTTATTVTTTPPTTTPAPPPANQSNGSGDTSGSVNGSTTPSVETPPVRNNTVVRTTVPVTIAPLPKSSATTVCVASAVVVTTACAMMF